MHILFIVRGTEVSEDLVCILSFLHSDLSNNEISEIADDAFHGLDSLNSL